MTIEFLSWSFLIKVWDRAKIELANPGSAVGFATNCASDLVAQEIEIYKA